MTGQFPPGPPLILAGFQGFSHPTVGPVGSSQGQQSRKGLDLNRYEFPPARPSVPSTDRGFSNRLFKTLILTSDVVLRVCR
jgi:hypothetical protein